MCYDFFLFVFIVVVLVLLGGLLCDKLVLLLDFIGEGIYGIDLEGCCIFINCVGVVMLGYVLVDVLGYNMYELVYYSYEYGGYYFEVECLILKVFCKGEFCWVDQEVFWCVDGSCFVIEYFFYQIIDVGQVCGVVIVFSDIFKWCQVEEQLQWVKVELEVCVVECICELLVVLCQVWQLLVYVYLVCEDECICIVCEIYDELGSLLVVFKLDVNWMVKCVVDFDLVVCKCEVMSCLIEIVVDNVGCIIIDLCFSIFDYQGLIVVLEWQVQEFLEVIELFCEVEFDIVLEVFVLNGVKVMVVFCIFQEMFFNVVCYVQVMQVCIVVYLILVELCMEVEDDGVGMFCVVQEVVMFYGVMGMCECVLYFGGVLSIVGVWFVLGYGRLGMLVCLCLFYYVSWEVL